LKGEYNKEVKMNKYILAASSSMILLGCNSTPKSNHGNLPLKEAELLSPKWQKSQRFQARYPIEEAM
jgi:hypothetical protein